MMPRGRSQPDSTWGHARGASASGGGGGSSSGSSSARTRVAAMRAWEEPANRAGSSNSTTHNSIAFSEKEWSPIAGERYVRGDAARTAANMRPTTFAYKAQLDKGKLDVLSQWRQGFEGRGVERCASGERHVGHACARASLMCLIYASHVHGVCACMYRYASGELYVGDIKHGDRDGTGIYHHTNGQVLLSRWRQNEPVGEGVQWSADKSYAVRTLNGKPTAAMSKDEGNALASKLQAQDASRFHSRRPMARGMANGRSAESKVRV